MQARRVANVVAPRLERKAKNRDARPVTVPPTYVSGELDYSRPTVQIDGVHFPKEVDHRLHSDLSGRGTEGANILRQATAAETEAGR